MSQEKLKITGMHCASCAMTIDEELEELDGVKESKTSYRKQLTKVVFDDERIDVDAIASAIQKLGYEAARV